MSPIRILILGILFYFLYRLLFGKRKKVAGSSNKNQGNNPPAQDILVEDPVCHTYIPMKKAIILNKDKQAYYFCCEKCRETFLTEEGDTK